MKLKTVRAVIFIITLSFIPLNSYARSKGPLELSLNFDKVEYKKNDGINLNISLKNTGKQSLYVNKRFFLNSEDSSPENREVYLTVEGPSGDKLPCKISNETGLPRTDNFVLLEPEQEARLDRDKNIKYFFDFSETGKYKITGTYQNIYGEEIGVDAFKGRVVSEPVVIEITE